MGTFPFRHLDVELADLGNFPYSLEYFPRCHAIVFIILDKDRLIELEIFSDICSLHKKVPPIPENGGE